MKLSKYTLFIICALGLAACNDIDDISTQGDGLTEAQNKLTVKLIPSRIEADFNGMFSMIGKPSLVFGEDADRADDFGFIMAAISQDAEGPDLVFPNSGYNWFSSCGSLTSRDPSYANPYIRYAVPYMQIKIANDLIRNYVSSEAEIETAEFSDEEKNKVAQCLAIRAFDYLSLAPYFQYSYAAGAQDEPCVPLATLDIEDYTHNPRATVKEVYDLVIKNLTWAIDNLDETRKSKMNINKNVALGLRARAYLATEQWALAADDAEKAAAGFTPASIEEVSTPTFYNIEDHNWIWGYDMTTDIANSSYATSCSWIGSFSKNSYSCGVAVYAMINNLLYAKIPATDVRKGWWLDEKLHSPLLSTIEWEGVKGDEISTLQIADVKEAYLPYTNVKFGAPQIPTEKNDSDWPLMRVEEMILIQAEGYAKSGDEAKAKEILSNFVKTYRDSSYTIPAASTRSLVDEIWFQRRVELWGEGFSWADMMRLNKPLVRFHDDKSNEPDAFRYNLPANDPWLLMRFPQDEINTNFGVNDNTGGTAPTLGQNPTLRDGVTD